MTAAGNVATAYPSGPELAIAAAWLAYAVWMARKMLEADVTPVRPVGDGCVQRTNSGGRTDDSTAATADAQEGQR